MSVAAAANASITMIALLIAGMVFPPWSSRFRGWRAALRILSWCGLWMAAAIVAATGDVRFAWIAVVVLIASGAALAAIVGSRQLSVSSTGQEREEIRSLWLLVTALAANTVVLAAAMYDSALPLRLREYAPATATSAALVAAFGYMAVSIGRTHRLEQLVPSSPKRISGKGVLPTSDQVFGRTVWTRIIVFGGALFCQIGLTLALIVQQHGLDSDASPRTWGYFEFVAIRLVPVAWLSVTAWRSTHESVTGDVLRLTSARRLSLLVAITAYGVLPFGLERSTHVVLPALLLSGLFAFLVDHSLMFHCARTVPVSRGETGLSSR